LGSSRVAQVHASRFNQGVSVSTAQVGAGVAQTYAFRAQGYLFASFVVGVGIPPASFGVCETVDPKAHQELRTCPIDIASPSRGVWHFNDLASYDEWGGFWLWALTLP
jgi:hypothetical protein